MLVVVPDWFVPVELPDCPMVSLLVLPDCPIELPDCPLELCPDWVESCANAVIEADRTSAHASVKSFFMKFCSFFYFLRISEWRSFFVNSCRISER